MKKITVIIISIAWFMIGWLNIGQDFLVIPDMKEMINRQLDLITISTVFIGFSFTSLGVLLGLSSEKLIERIKETSIIMDKVTRIVTSIIFFVLSVAVSLYFVLGLNNVLISRPCLYEISNKLLYVMGIGYLVSGIGFFVYSVYELYDLLKRIYRYNAAKTDKLVESAKQELERNAQKLQSAIYEDD